MSAPLVKPLIPSAPLLDDRAGRSGELVYTSPSGARVTVPLADIVGAQHMGMGAEACVEVYAYETPVAAFCCSQRVGVERVRRVHRVLDAAAPAELAARLRRALRGGGVGGGEDTSEDAARGRLLVVINPTSGPGGALARYQAHCEPMLADAGWETTVHVTQREHEATSFLRGAPDLGSYAGILAVGGDGTVHEVLQGLLSRPDAARLLGRGGLRLGVLPAGSGNGLAHGFCAAAGLPFSLSNAALLIAQRRCVRLDVASVFTAGGAEGAGADEQEQEEAQGAGAEAAGGSAGGSGAAASATLGPAGAGRLWQPPAAWGARRFSFLSLEWGVVADLDIESEALRCLGAARFDLFGALRGLFLRRYTGRLSWRPAAPLAPEGGPCDAAPRCLDVRPRLLAPLAAPLPGGAAAWQSREGVFTFLWVTNTSFQSAGVSMAPAARGDDGVFTITLVRACSRWQMLALLLSLDAHGSHAQLPFVEVHTADAFRLEPNTSEPLAAKGNIVVDGELVPYAPVQAELHAGLLPAWGVL